MARKVFFSFHYERDAWRAANVRNADLLADEDEYGVIDRAEWEEIEGGGDKAIREWIQSQLKHTTCTVVLIGAETASREWVLYEIRESWKRGNGIVGLRIHGIKGPDQKTDTAGENPLDNVMLDDGSPLASVCKTYDWCDDCGRDNLGTWVEEACKIREECDKELKEATATAAKSFTSTAVAKGPTIITNPPRPWSR